MVSEKVENPSIYFDIRHYKGQVGPIADAQTYLGHYLGRGCHEGLEPVPFFSGKDYLEANEDVRESGSGPIPALSATGIGERRDPMKGLSLENT